MTKHLAVVGVLGSGEEPHAGKAEAVWVVIIGVAVVAVDRFIYAAGVDLADPVAVDRLCDVAEQPSQLRLW